MLSQYQQIFLAHDDYGYAVYHGAIQTGFEGQNFSFGQGLAFLVDHYIGWSGRLASHFFHIYAQKIGLDFVRFVSALTVAGIACFSFMIVRTVVSNPIASFLQRNGMDSSRSVRLFKLKDERFKSTPMPYERSYSYIEFWMKKYYRLDPDTEFTWERYDVDT